MNFIIIIRFLTLACFQLNYPGKRFSSTWKLFGFWFGIFDKMAKLNLWCKTRLETLKASPPWSGNLFWKFETRKCKSTRLPRRHRLTKVAWECRWKRGDRALRSWRSGGLFFCGTFQSKLIQNKKSGRTSRIRLKKTTRRNRAETAAAAKATHISGGEHARACACACVCV